MSDEPDMTDYVFEFPTDWPESVKAAVLAHLKEIKVDTYDGYDNCDQFRFAGVGSWEELKAYAEIASKGCCGSYDKVINVQDYGQVLVGFNYGH